MSRMLLPPIFTTLIMVTLVMCGCFGPVRPEHHVSIASEMTEKRKKAFKEVETIVQQSHTIAVDGKWTEVVVVEIDGIDYIIVSNLRGIAITQKGF